ncbi:MAG: agmatinase family protein [Deltaproteobacteria bacterium]|jgi:agmatinase|nr:agmatinase family protein [Deltaproteobacteria bacterium]MBW2537163.1 agmatinase family protein [Deltaproteobacteria bacterium]
MSGIYGLSCAAEEAAAVLVPVPWEATVSYGRGTARAPEAILAASVQVDLYDLETGEPHRAGIAMLPPDRSIALANTCASERIAAIVAAHGPIDESPPPEALEACAAVDRISRDVHRTVRATVERWLDRGKLVAVVGGDHSAAFGSIAAHGARRPGLGVLQIDAHADLRDAYQGFELSHGSVMDRVLREVDGVAKLVSVGVRDLCDQEHARIRGSRGRIAAFFGPELARRSFAGEPFLRIAQEIAAQLPDEVYVSFDVDGLDPSLCPHTGTPVPGGLGFDQACALLGAVVRSGRRIVGFDLCEVAPGPPGDEWDANVGARLLYKLVGYGLLSWRR